ncbi:hypothetical protein [Streptomyces sp. NBC_01565]|nr:hypothetical protein [Streptomyces sp. NBC_01565]MCX4545763.1 hypothetical protein [Streptomyces sp. NBC_01565]
MRLARTLLAALALILGSASAAAADGFTDIEQSNANVAVNFSELW